MQYGFSETANKEITEFDQNGRCTKWNDILFAAQGRSGSALHNECERDGKGRIVNGALYDGFYAQDVAKKPSSITVTADSHA